MSNTLLRFLKDWKAWADDDAPPHPVFSSDRALCGNLFLYLPFTAEESGTGVEMKLCELLRRDFDTSRHPFGKDIYNQEVTNRSHHRNAARLEWVEEIIEELSA